MNTVFEDQELKQKLEEAMAAHKHMPVKEKTPKPEQEKAPATGSYEEHKDQVERQAL